MIILIGLNPRSTSVTMLEVYYEIAGAKVAMSFSAGGSFTNDLQSVAKDFGLTRRVFEIYK